MLPPLSRRLLSSHEVSCRRRRQSTDVAPARAPAQLWLPAASMQWCGDPGAPLLPVGGSLQQPARSTVSIVGPNLGIPPQRVPAARERGALGGPLPQSRCHNPRTGLPSVIERGGRSGDHCATEAPPPAARAPARGYIGAPWEPGFGIKGIECLREISQGIHAPNQGDAAELWRGFRALGDPHIHMRIIYLLILRTWRCTLSPLEITIGGRSIPIIRFRIGTKPLLSSRRTRASGVSHSPDL